MLIGDRSRGKHRRKSHLGSKRARWDRAKINSRWATLQAEAILAGLSDHDLCLCVEIPTSHYLAFALLACIVQHVMHLIVDHIITELITLRTRKLPTDLAVARDYASFALVMKLR